jgi:hypothetical protein
MGAWYKLRRQEAGKTTVNAGYLYMDGMAKFQLVAVMEHPPPSFFPNTAIVQPYPESSPIEQTGSGWGWAYVSQPALGTSAWMLGDRAEQRLLSRWLRREPMPAQSYSVVPWT